MIEAYKKIGGELVAGHPLPKGAYPDYLKPVLSLKAGQEAVAAISQWPGYAQTPLVALSSLAQGCGFRSVFYKHEAGRFGLGSFKALGGAYAVFRLLTEIIREKTGKTPKADALFGEEYAQIVANVTVCCATDGNHGRSVAWGASLFGCKSVIYIHADVSKGREAAIASYGAKVIRIDGNYDDSVRQAARMADEQGWFVVSDTSYPGYEDIPRNVMQGYSVMAAEILEQMSGEVPTHVFIQGGVGGLPAAMTAHFWETYAEKAPKIVCVEPVNAACLMKSAQNGKISPVTGAMETIMAGLACGEPSMIAWPILEGGVSAFMAIEDEAVVQTMRLLASGEAGAVLVGGESGTSGLAGLLVACARPDWRKSLDLGPDSIVLCIGSEGDTDPELYEKITGKSAQEVLA